jgi:lipopolysaccharide export system permease protein
MTVIRPILLLAVAASLASFAINNFLEPHTRERLRVIVSESRADLITTVIQEGAFQQIEPGLSMQIGERLPDGRFGGIFVADTREENVELLYYAKSGTTTELNGQHLLVMQDGVVHRKTDGRISIVRYKSYAIDLSEFMPQGSGPTLLPKDRTLAYLMNPSPNDPIFKDSPQGFRAELHRRFTEWTYPLVFALIGLAVAGDSRSFREARLHPLLTTMTIALIVRWAGFFVTDKLWNEPAYTPLAYAVPAAGAAVAIFFIATNRVLELPVWVIEYGSGLWNHVQQRLVALRLRLSGYRKPASRGSA